MADLYYKNIILEGMGSDRISDWEREFLGNIKDNDKYSVKQYEILNRIKGKLSITPKDIHEYLSNHLDISVESYIDFGPVSKIKVSLLLGGEVISEDHIETPVVETN